MGLRINTNVSSLAAQRTLGQTTTKQQGNLAKLSSGSRINMAADDAAGLAISEKLKAQIRSTEQANRNANDGISMIQTAEGGLNEVSSILVRLRELSIQSSSDTVGETERGFTDLEFQNLKSEVQRIANSTEYNGTKLLNGTAEQLDFQIGTRNVASEDRVIYDAGAINSTLDSLGIDGLGVSQKESAREGLEVLDQALDRISGQRAVLGANQNRLQSVSNNLQVSKENISAANSRIRDTDYAMMTSENAKLNILSNAGTSVLAQSNSAGAAALKLIG